MSALLLLWDGKEMLAESAGDDLASALGSPRTRRRPDTTEHSLLGDDGDDAGEADE